MQKAGKLNKMRLAALGLSLFINNSIHKKESRELHARVLYYYDIIK